MCILFLFPYSSSPSFPSSFVCVPASLPLSLTLLYIYIFFLSMVYVDLMLPASLIYFCRLDSFLYFFFISFLPFPLAVPPFSHCLTFSSLILCFPSLLPLLSSLSSILLLLYSPVLLSSFFPYISRHSLFLPPSLHFPQSPSFFFLPSPSSPVPSLSHTLFLTHIPPFLLLAHPPPAIPTFSLPPPPTPHPNSPL